MPASNPPDGKRPPSFDGADEFPLPFGNYILLQAFARGGMGEVYLAKRTGAILGAEKYCVLKKLRPELTRDREYVARFIDEARIVVQLSHANICQVFDVGRVGDEYYLAMEYVSGRDARSLQDKARDQDRSLDEASVLQLITETLAALDYAHRRTHSLTGESLNLVHRDVSPQNVMVSFEGEVKLIDFGLASSRLKVERTQPNIVMGKMAYMAPEQARGDGIDRRADLFAAGVILYELLAGERFYEGMSSNDIWMVVGRGGYVPNKWDTLSPGIAAILGRALHPDVNQRYADCGEFREALVSYLHTNHPGKGERALRELVQQVFAAEIAAERERLAGFGDVSGEFSGDVLEMTRSQSVSLAHADSIPDSTSGGSARVVHDERTRIKPDIDDLPTQSVQASELPSFATDMPTAEGETGSGEGGISEEQTLLEQPAEATPPRAAPTPTEASDPTQRTTTPPTGQAIPALGPAEATEAIARGGRRAGAAAGAATVVVPRAPVEGAPRRSPIGLALVFLLLVAVGLAVAWVASEATGGAPRDADPPPVVTDTQPDPPEPEPPPPEPTSPEPVPPEPAVPAVSQDAGPVDEVDEVDEADETDDVAEADATDEADQAEARASRRSLRDRRLLARADKHLRQGEAELNKRGYKSAHDWPADVKRLASQVESARSARQKARVARRFRDAARGAPDLHEKAAPTPKPEPKKDPPKKDPPKKDPPKKEAAKPRGMEWLRKQSKLINEACNKAPPRDCDPFLLIQRYAKAGSDTERLRLERKARSCAKNCK